MKVSHATLAALSTPSSSKTKIATFDKSSGMTPMEQSFAHALRTNHALHRTPVADQRDQASDDAPAHEQDDVPTKKIEKLREAGGPQAELDVEPTPSTMALPVGQIDHGSEGSDPARSHTAHVRGGSDDRTATKPVLTALPTSAPLPIEQPQSPTKDTAATAPNKSASHAVTAHARAGQPNDKREVVAAKSSTEGQPDDVGSKTTTADSTKPVDVSALPATDMPSGYRGSKAASEEIDATTLAASSAAPSASVTSTATSASAVSAVSPVSSAAPSAHVPAAAALQSAVATSTTNSAPTSAPPHRAPHASSADAASEAHASDPATRGHMETHNGRAEITIGEGDDRVTLRIATGHHTVRVEATAASPELNSALQKNQSQLRDQLSQHGLDLDFHSGASPERQAPSESRAETAPSKTTTTATSKPSATITARGVRVVA